MSSLIRISTALWLFASPRRFSQLVTSFFGSWYLGILPVPLLAWPFLLDPLLDIYHLYYRFIDSLYFTHIFIFIFIRLFPSSIILRVTRIPYNTSILVTSFPTFDLFSIFVVFIYSLYSFQCTIFIKLPSFQNPLKWALKTKQYKVYALFILAISYLTFNHHHIKLIW